MPSHDRGQTRRLLLRPFQPKDEPALLAGRDAQWSKWLGPGQDHPHPSACIVLEGQIIGWIDADPDHERLRPGETNIGYTVFAPYRGHGYATAAVGLMLEWLADEGTVEVATLSVHRENLASLRVAEKAGFSRVGENADEVLFARALR